MAFKHLEKLLLLVLLVAFVNSEDDCKHTICVGVEEGHFLDNPANCSQFFTCVNGRAQPGTCPDGFFFHPSLQKCEVHWQVPCNPTEEIELECVDDGDGGNGDNGDNGNGNEDPPLVCNTNDVQLLQHPTNCSKYVLCFHGVAHVKSCAPGLEWDVTQERCNTPEVAQCVLSECPFQDDPQQPVFLYNDNQCENFALCVNGLPQWRSCAQGFHWDRVNQWCTTPQEAGCEEWVEPPVDEIECHEDSPLRNPHPTLCNIYFICYEGESFMRFCAEGSIFDYYTRSCTSPDVGTCYSDRNQSRKQPQHSVKPIKTRNGEFDHLCQDGDPSPVREHPDTCLKFIICDFDTGASWALPCADGHVFIRELYACVPGNVDTCQAYVF